MRRRGVAEERGERDQPTVRRRPARGPRGAGADLGEEAREGRTLGGGGVALRLEVGQVADARVRLRLEADHQLAFPERLERVLGGHELDRDRVDLVPEELDRTARLRLLHRVAPRDELARHCVRDVPDQVRVRTLVGHDDDAGLAVRPLDLRRVPEVRDGDIELDGLQVDLLVQQRFGREREADAVDRDRLARRHRAQLRAGRAILDPEAFAALALEPVLRRRGVARDAQAGQQYLARDLDRLDDHQVQVERVDHILGQRPAAQDLHLGLDLAASAERAQQARRGQSAGAALLDPDRRRGPVDRRRQRRDHGAHRDGERDRAEDQPAVPQQQVPVPEQVDPLFFPAVLLERRVVHGAPQRMNRAMKRVTLVEMSVAIPLLRRSQLRWGT